MKVYLPLPLKDIAFVLFTKAKIFVFGLLTSPLMALDEDNRLLEKRSQMPSHQLMSSCTSGPENQEEQEWPDVSLLMCFQNS